MTLKRKMFSEPTIEPPRPIPPPPPTHRPGVIVGQHDGVTETGMETDANGEPWMSDDNGSAELLRALSPRGSEDQVGRVVSETSPGHIIEHHLELPDGTRRVVHELRLPNVNNGGPRMLRPGSGGGAGGAGSYTRGVETVTYTVGEGGAAGIVEVGTTVDALTDFARREGMTLVAEGDGALRLLGIR